MALEHEPRCRVENVEARRIERQLELDVRLHGTARVEDGGEDGLVRGEQGHFVVLCWNGDGPAPGGPVTAAIEGGLHHFADALFDELRSDGVRATTIYARPNEQTSPEAALALDPQSAINPELVAEAVENLFRSRPSNVVTTLVIRPAALVETPRIMRSAELAGLATRDCQLPSRQNFRREPERIPTPVPSGPADEAPPGLEDFEDED